MENKEEDSFVIGCWSSLDVEIDKNNDLPIYQKESCDKSGNVWRHYKIKYDKGCCPLLFIAFQTTIDDMFDNNKKGDFVLKMPYGDNIIIPEKAFHDFFIRQ